MKMRLFLEDINQPKPNDRVFLNVLLKEYNKAHLVVIPSFIQEDYNSFIKSNHIEYINPLTSEQQLLLTEKNLNDNLDPIAAALLYANTKISMSN